MRKVTKSFWDKPIRTKLNMVFMLLIVLPLCVVMVIVSAMTRNRQLSQLERSSEQYLKQSAQGISNSLSGLNNILISNLWNKELLDYLNQDPAFLSSPGEKNAIHLLLRSMGNARKDIECLILVKNSGEKFSYSARESEEVFYEYLEQELPDMGWQSGIFWSGIASANGYVMGVRKIKDFESLKEVGFIYVFLQEETIRQLYEDLKTAPGSFFQVLDAQGQVVSSNHEASENLANLQLREGQGLQPVRVDGAMYYVQETYLSELGWYIREYTPKKEIMQDIYRLQIIISSVFLIIMGTLLLVMNRFSESLTMSIRKLQSSMLEVRNENFKVRAPVIHQDEMGELTETFNMMTGRIQQLIEEDYKSKLLLKETEFRFLRAQINPHFLYNTLDAISWKAAMGGDKEVSKMAVALGRILRWSISKTDASVSLAEETENVEDYLSIQKMRYGDSLSYVIAVGEAESKMLVPKMILQPLVENALVHGLEEKEGDKRLLIAAKEEKDLLQISIRDNGVGMSQERIEKVLGGRLKQEKQHGVGLYNVHQRIQMSYGEVYGIEIKSKLGEGTEILIRLPKGGKSIEDTGVNRRG